MLKGQQVLQRGTVLRAAGPKGDPHLHIIMNDPAFCPIKACEAVLMVAISSVRRGQRVYDKTCLLDVGDHPFIKHASYIFYRDAKVFSVERLRDAIAQGDVKPRADMDPAVFQRVRDGFTSSTKSRQIQREVERYINNVLVPKGLI